jgi:hypothetical protein
MKYSTLLKAGSVAFIALAVWYSFFIISPPEPKPITASLSEFSAERALKHIRQISVSPHPLGTAANDSVRAYIIRELQSLGLKPSVQEGVGRSRRRGIAGYVRNILATLPGSDSKHTILLMAHYDSVPTGPGAGDDAMGIAAILETVRALKAGAPLKNDVMILLTDGEELGLMGAEYFVNEYENLDQIDLVLNVEARGTSGASIMFETSPNNSELIPHFSKATTNPVANSLTYTVYKLLPNDTDMSVTKRAGLKGLNFAIAEDFLNYHTMQDNPENLSLRSLQHHGQNLLENVRYFASRSLNLQSQADYVYFNNFTGGLAYYPESWSFPVATLLITLFVCYLALLHRRQRFSVRYYLLGILAFGAFLITGIALSHFGWQFMQWINPEYEWLTHGETYEHSWYLIGFSALMLSLLLAWGGWLKQRLGTNNLLAAVLTYWIFLSVVLAWHLPSAAYLPTWPALFALLGWMAVESRPWKTSWKWTLILWLSLLPALFLISPYIKLFQVMLTTGMLAVSMVLLMLLAGLCLLLLWQITEPGRRYWVAALLVVFAFCVSAASFSSGFDAEHKKHNHMIYLSDLDQSTAVWLSRDHATDRWTSQFLGENPARAVTPYIHSPLWDPDMLHARAPFEPTPSASLKLMSDSSDGSYRYLTVEVQSKIPANGFLLSLDEGQAMVAAGVQGRELFDRQKQDAETHITGLNRIQYFADMTSPVEINLKVPNTDTDIKLVLTLLRWKLPVHLVSNYKPRDPYMMTIPHPISDATLWKKTYRLQGLK